jgi:hypothetical protein
MGLVASLRRPLNGPRPYPSSSSSQKPLSGGNGKYTVLEQIMRNTLGYIQMIVVDYMNRSPRSSPLSSTPDGPSTTIL